MRGWIWPIVLATTLALGGVARAQTVRQTPPKSGNSALNQVVNKIIGRENQLMAQVRRYTPIVELYVQDMRPTVNLGPVPVKDYYYLGQAHFAHGIQFLPLHRQGVTFASDLTSPFRHFFSSSYNPDGFLEMIFPDARGLSRADYTFHYVHETFLGDVRCMVFNVVPKPHSGQGRFKGRIWVENRHFTIVRFNGVFTPTPAFGRYFQFDSWRVNVAPGVWLPAFVYSQENGKKGLLGHGPRFRAQMRLWGYNLSPVAREEELSRILVQSSQPIRDPNHANTSVSPVQAELDYESEATRNVLDRLQSLGLLAPPGPVDKVLDTVVNNLIVSNKINLDPPVHCRVLMTTPLEAFAVGHTIVLSRGLIDVLPDEPSLATILAQELAEILLGHSMDTKYAFSDRMIFNVKNTFHVLDFHESRKSEVEASAKAVELLKNSPYKNSLGQAGLFLKALQAESKDLPELISPQLGNRPQEIQAIEQLGPQLQPSNVKQIAALPLGSRIKVNPWNDHVAMMKTRPVPLLNARMKMPFELAPFYLHLERAKGTSAGLAQAEAAHEKKP
jgi:hypothetical protein